MKRAMWWRDGKKGKKCAACGRALTKDRTEPAFCQECSEALQGQAAHCGKEAGHVQR